MNKFLKISMAAALVASSVVAAAPEASAHSHKWADHGAECVDNHAVVPILLLGAVLGAATGGIASGIAYGAAYAVGGAAIGAGGGATLGLIHGDLRHC